MGQLCERRVRFVGLIRMGKDEVGDHNWRGGPHFGGRRGVIGCVRHSADKAEMDRPESRLMVPLRRESPIY